MAAARARRDADLDVPEAPPRMDAYTGLLIIAFIATLIGILFLWLDYSQYEGKPDFNRIKAPPPAAAPK